MTLSEHQLSGLKLMRDAFPPNHISKLPKPTKKQTEELKADFRKGQRCTICGGWHQQEVIHLDYVGHAALTDRLLDVDPEWNWEPLAIGDNGLPVLDGYGGMWIRLTVLGVTRLGYGHAGEKEGGDAIKEVIGDAMRNAAMRFGAALELWHKGKLHADEDADRTYVMKCRTKIQEHITNGRDLGALQEWAEACERGEATAAGVWAGLTTPERDKLRELKDAQVKK